MTDVHTLDYCTLEFLLITNDNINLQIDLYIMDYVVIFLLQ